MITTEIEATIQTLARRWAEARVLLPAFPLLARGEPLEVDAIAEASGTSVERVNAALAAGRCERTAAGQIIELYGMTLEPNLHRLSIDGRVVFSCCALWAHAIPRLLAQPVQIESVDPVTRQLVHLSVSRGQVESTEPTGAVATLAVASRDAVEKDVAAAFCSNVRHFVSQDSAERFAAGSPSRRVVSLSELDRAANQLLDGIRSATTCIA